MTTIFDAASVEFDQYWLFVIPGVALLLTILALLRGAARKWRVILPGVTILLFLLCVVLPLADHHHVQAALTNGSARTVAGVVSAHKRETIRRWTGSSRGVGVTSSDTYTSSTSEQFFVGQTWFWLRVGGFPSDASFTNASDPPLPLRDGQRVRLTWFPDPWNGDEKRILKVEMDERPAENRATAADLPADFATFWTRFSVAAAKGDRDGVKALTRFPFLFSGTPLDAGRFDSIWMGIFPAPLRPCFASAMPVRDGEVWSVSCGVYVYVFAKGAAGWQFTDFTADPEAAE